MTHRSQTATAPGVWYSGPSQGRQGEPSKKNTQTSAIPLQHDVKARTKIVYLKNQKKVILVHSFRCLPLALLLRLIIPQCSRISATDVDYLGYCGIWLELRVAVASFDELRLYPCSASSVRDAPLNIRFTLALSKTEQSNFK